MNDYIQMTESTVIAPGLYMAAVQDVEHDDGQYGPQFRWTFALDGGVELTAWSSVKAKYTRKAKTAQWVRAVLGNVDSNARVSLDDVIGKPCQVEVTVETSGEGEQFNRVAKVHPADFNPIRPSAPQPLAQPPAMPVAQSREVTIGDPALEVAQEQTPDANDPFSGQ